MPFKSFAMAMVGLLLLTGCSIAPFSPVTSGRSLGGGKIGADFGSANSSYYIRAMAGVSPNVDVGYVLEFGQDFSTSGLFGKLSFINNRVGPSLALEGGYGASSNSDYYNIGLVGSIAFTESFEVFLNARYNNVETDAKDIDIDERAGHMLVEKEDLKYVLASTGFNAWFNQNFGISIFVTHAHGDGIKWEEGSAFGASFLLNI